MIFKFNGGRGAVLCGGCMRILYEGKDIPEYIWDAYNKGILDAYPDEFCEECIKKNMPEVVFTPPSDYHLFENGVLRDSTPSTMGYPIKKFKLIVKDDNKDSNVPVGK